MSFTSDSRWHSDSRLLLGLGQGGCLFGCCSGRGQFFDADVAVAGTGLTSRRMNLFSPSVAARFDDAVQLAAEAFVAELNRLVEHLLDRLSGQTDGKRKVFCVSAVESGPSLRVGP